MAIDSFSGKYRWLSNFYGSEKTADIGKLQIEFDGVVFPSVENAYQAAKCANKEDIPFFVTCTAGQAKRQGRKVKTFDDWDGIKAAIMHNLVSQKFNNEPLKSMLIATAGTELVEGNTWHDVFFGSCQCGGPDWCDVKKTKGLNRLGSILMDVRDMLVMERRQRSYRTIEDLLGGAGTIGFVGSRACGEAVLVRLGAVAGWAALAGKNGVSGGAEGADQKAADKYVEYGAAGNFHVHMPWPQYNNKHIVPDGCTFDIFSNKFNKRGVEEFMVSDEDKAFAIDLAKKYARGSWESRSDAAKVTLGRNALIVNDCDVLVYALAVGDDGEIVYSPGTQHDVRIATGQGKVCFNMNDDNEWAIIKDFLLYQKILMEEAQDEEDRLNREEDYIEDKEPSCEDINENRERLSEQDPYDESKLAEY